MAKCKALTGLAVKGLMCMYKQRTYVVLFSYGRNQIV